MGGRNEGGDEAWEVEPFCTPPLYYLTSPISSSMVLRLFFMAMALGLKRSDLKLSIGTREACFACKPIELLDLGINIEAVG